MAAHNWSLASWAAKDGYTVPSLHLDGTLHLAVPPSSIRSELGWLELDPSPPHSNPRMPSTLPLIHGELGWLEPNLTLLATRYSEISSLSLLVLLLSLSLILTHSWISQQVHPMVLAEEDAGVAEPVVEAVAAKE